MKNKIGVCSWSLKNDAEGLARVLGNTGLSSLHLDVSAADKLRGMIAEKGWTVSCTMVGFPQEDYSSLDAIRLTGGIVPDDVWPENRQIVLDAIGTTADMGVKLLSFHAGFIDHTDEAGFQTFRKRISEFADVAQESGITILLETGQETAEDLRHFLDVVNHPALGVNFDPANMILYGKGDPIEAVGVLGPWIKHVHIKDAVASQTPGQWGAEVPWGEGEVNHGGFFQALEKVGFTGAMAIEREAGDRREKDIQLTVERLEVCV
ncbi:sugar phosphate isomerase/epimerase family protein [Pontiella sp.]|uniref:sugar phosphate isomerase/epimerase family protein n=1 Tax=Pontiella sp. TaxID=2837462 RepID=UPI003563CF3D